MAVSTDFSNRMKHVYNCLQRERNPRVPLAGFLRWVFGFSVYKPPVIDKNLNFISRWGVQWWTLALLNPIFQFFGFDLLSSVRASQVAQGVLGCFKKNQEQIPDKVISINQVLRILQQLDKISGRKYHQEIGDVKRQILEFLPDPKTTRPEEPFVPQPDPNVLVWPPNLPDLGIDSSVQTNVEAVFNECKELMRGNGSPLVVERRVNGDIKLRFLYDERNNLKDVVLMTPPKFREEGGRSLFLCYNLTRGQYCFAKEGPRSEERVLLSKLIRGAVPGLSPPMAVVRTSLDSELPERWEILERCGEGTLPCLFSTRPLLTDPKQVMSLAEDFFSALAFIHSQPRNVIFTNPQGDRVLKQSFFFHGRISCDNVLVETEGVRWRAILSGFNTAGSFEAQLGIPGFRPPEYVKFYADTSHESSYETIRFNYDHAHGADVWAMGLVVLTILCGDKAQKSSELTDVAKMNIPPLPCLKECFSMQFQTPDRNVKDISQANMDGDLEHLHQTHKDNHGENNPETDILWEIVKGMLQVDPQKRISAQEALSLFQNAPK